jgi:hypothetical protein
MMPRYQVWLLLFMILGGGAIAATLTQEPHHVVSGETVNQHEVSQEIPFLPMYLDMISGKTKPADTCEAHTLEQLLMPCETNR